MKNIKHAVWLASSIATLFTGSLFAEETFKPYVLANPSTIKADDVKKALTTQGFTIAGTYSPYAGTTILIATNDGLKKAAAASKFGGYGAAIRIAITEVNGQPQTSYVNPNYMKNAYRMKADLTAVTSALTQALGQDKTFGAKEGMSADELRKYHYMMAMPYFDDHIELAEYDSYTTAVAKVERGLSAGNATKKVYRIDIPNKEETVFGVALTEGEGADKTVMNSIDNGDLRHSAHLPYEVLVSGNKAYMLHGKFRIAQSFPDLGMGSFMSISAAPDAIENTIKSAIQ